MEYCIGMDVGGTTARLEIADTHGKVLCRSEGRGGTPLGCGNSEMTRRLAALLEPALREAGLVPEECGSLVAGASGIDSERQREEYAGMLRRLGFPGNRIHVYNDCELLLELMPPPCIALIAGTGSVAMGRAESGGPVRRSGGWSYLLSDEGSAPSIAIAALRLLIRHWDGREESPALAALAAEKYGFGGAEDVVDFFHSHLGEKDRIAAFAPLAEQAAELGDDPARRILLKAADELADLVRSAAAKLSVDGRPFSLLLWGSVALRSALISSRLVQILRKTQPGIRVYRLQASAVSCAARLACGLPAKDALEELVPPV